MIRREQSPMDAVSKDRCVVLRGSWRWLTVQSEHLRPARRQTVADSDPVFLRAPVPSTRGVPYGARWC
ncbi:MAG: hypothetical protein OXR72_17415 [Gemmatimonadota bacterium]|nr:hypothetical protein [Gemmatimonadota bacterium]